MNSDELAQAYLASIVTDRIVENKQRAFRRSLVCKYIDVLLEFVPFHCCMSCTDRNPCNPNRCTRCTLLEVKRDGISDYDVTITTVRCLDLPTDPKRLVVEVKEREV